MNMKFNNIARTVLTVALMGTASMVMAQKGTQVLKGRVVDVDGNPISGAVVNVAEQSRIALTDDDGYFSLKGVKLAEEINVACLGYKGANGEAVFDGSFQVTLEAEGNKLDAMVPVPFGEKEARLTTESTSKVTGDELEKFPVTILQNAFTATLNGVETYEWASEPGWSETQMYIRGIRTTNTSARSPLVIVDNVERDLSFLDAYPIESIQVLKDNAATAIYGMRGANGAIIVTTKRGVAGKTKISLTQEFGWQTLTNRFENQGSYNQAITRNRVRYLDGNTPMYSDYDIEQYRRLANGETLEGIDKYKYFDTNWFDVMYRDAAPQMKTNFQISGGNNRARYYVSFSYLHQGGMWNETTNNKNEVGDGQHSLDRFNLRSNIDIDINKYLNVKLDLGGRIDNIEQPVDPVFNIVTFGAVEATPFEPEFCPNGEVYGSSTAQSPYDFLSTGYNRNRRRNLYSTLTVNADLSTILKGLSLFGTASFDSYETVQNQQRTGIASYNYPYSKLTDADLESIENGTYSNYTAYWTLVSANSESFSTRDYYYNLNLNGGIGFNRNFGKHGVDAKAFVRFYRQEVSGSESSRRQLSLNATLQYNYDKRYIIQGNFSRMGDDNFDEDNRWANFMGISGAWNLGEESFIKDNVKFIDQLKFRASYGRAGQSAGNTTRYAYQSTYGTATGYNFGYSQTGVNGYYESLAGNPNNLWEVGDMQNYGLDFDLWNGKLYGSFDWFREDRKNVLVTRSSVPSLIGVNLAKDSYGKIKSWGYEAKLGHKGKIGKKFNYFVEANLTFNDNEVIDLDAPAATVPWQDVKGHRIYDNTEVAALYEQSFNGSVGGWNIYRFDQWARDPNLVATSHEDALAHPEKYPFNTFAAGKQKIGTAVFQDVNGDRKIDQDDMCPDTYTMIPRYVTSLNLGFEFMGFDASVILTAYLNRSVFLSPASAWSGWGNMGTHNVVDCWGYYTDDPNDQRNIDAKWPRPMWGGYNTEDSDRGTGTYKNDVWIQNGDYLSLKNLQVGYSLPKRLIAKAWMTKCRFYFNAYNVCTWSHLPDGMDPEKPMSYCWWYPKTRSFSFGVNIGF